MISTLISVATAAVSGYLAASFLQTVLHRWLGHRPAARFFFRRHVFEHHRIYSHKRLVTRRYSDVERSLTPYYVAPGATVVLALARVLPAAPAAGFSIAMLASYAAHAYIHEHYHLEHSWMDRWRWFRRRRELHHVHHRNTARNFAVIDYFWDRLLGTFESPSSAAPPRGVR